VFTCKCEQNYDFKERCESCEDGKCI
jgi:hypothetical protein